MGKQPPSKKLKILLADDHAILRAGLRLLVNAEPDMEVVGEAADGKQASEAVKECYPDVVVMDLSMPECDGAQATREVKRICPHAKVLVLTVQEDTAYLSQLLNSGASGYMLKRAAAEELTRAIRTVARGGQYIDPVIAARFVNAYVIEPPQVDSRGSLSKREEDVLRLIAWGYSNKEIAAELDISVKTVETYKVRLTEKLNLHGRVDMVRYAVRQGWLQEP
ncbi:MAG TPA: response regulator transcription factor [Blastocatellia bacterium]|nr:response regulator transcription factor [Blastocatellia bacterium]